MSTTTTDREVLEQALREGYIDHPDAIRNVLAELEGAEDAEAWLEAQPGWGPRPPYTRKGKSIVRALLQYVSELKAENERLKADAATYKLEFSKAVTAMGAVVQPGGRLGDRDLVGLGHSITEEGPGALADLVEKLEAENERLRNAHHDLCELFYERGDRIEAALALHTKQQGRQECECGYDWEDQACSSPTVKALQGSPEK